MPRFSFFLFLLLSLAVAGFAVLNRHDVPLYLLPAGTEAEMAQLAWYLPLYLLLFIPLILGFLLSSLIASWQIHRLKRRLRQREKALRTAEERLRDIDRTLTPMRENHSASLPAPARSERADAA